MRPLGSVKEDSKEEVRYSSWTEKSREKPAYARSDFTESVTSNQPVSAQNLDPAVAQEYYRQQQQKVMGGNSSGNGPQADIPADASGFTAAGCVPFGLFAFANGQIALGILGLISSFIPFLGLIYIVIVAMSGRKLAWQGRRFSDVHQFASTMEVWNVWGWVLFALNFITSFIIGFNEGFKQTGGRWP